VTLSKILTEKAMDEATKLSGMLAEGYKNIIKDANIKAIVQWAGTSGTIHFTRAKKIENWRDFAKTIDIARWYLYTVIMMNRGIIPSALGPDEQWTISVQHTKEDIEKHLEVFKEIARHVRKLDLEMPLVEAV
jgi:glutamate-1-semialdehyde 2,1-aminomutase